jgi:hypothetical protein
MWITALHPAVGRRRGAKASLTGVELQISNMSIGPDMGPQRSSVSIGQDAKLTVNRKPGWGKGASPGDEAKWRAITNDRASIRAEPVDS